MHRRFWFLSFVIAAIALFAAAPLPRVAQDASALKQQVTERIEAEVADTARQTAKQTAPIPDPTPEPNPEPNPEPQKPAKSISGQSDNDQ